MNTAIGNDTETVLRQWRTSILNGFFTIAAAISLPALAAIIANAFSRPETWSIAISFSIVEVFLIGLAVFRGIPFEARVGSLWLIGYAACILNLMNTGLNGGGPLYLLAIPVLILVLAGKRPGILTGAFSGLLAAGSAFLTARGLLTPTWITRTPWMTFTTILMFLTIVMALLILFYRFQEGLINEERLVHSELRRAHALLEEQNANLEKKVEERTVELRTANLSLEQRNAELAIINSVHAGLASQLDIQTIYELVGNKIYEIFDANTVVLTTFDLNRDLMYRHYVIERGVRYNVEPLPISNIWQQFIRQGRSILINSGLQEFVHQIDPAFKVPVGEVPKCSLSVPLKIKGVLYGVISLQNVDRENAFSESDVRLLETIANSLSVALENARLFDETQRLLKETERRAQELATVNAVSVALVGELDLTALIELVGEQIRSVFKADIAYVALLDKETNVINFPYQYGQQLESIQLGQGLTSRIILSGQPLLINKDMDLQRQQMGVTLIGKRAQSFLGVPIFIGGETIGVVSIQSTKYEGRFTENDQRLLGTIAANVGIAFQNARLFNEIKRLFQAERQAHDLAETLRSVAQALNGSLSLTEVLDLVLTEIQKVIPYDSAGIYHVHENRRILVAGHGFANLEDLLGVSFEFNKEDDEIGYLISKSLQPLILTNASEQYPQYFDTGVHATTRIRGYMAVPIVLDEELIGMITLDKNEPDFYTEQHARLAVAFAAQAATAIHNARLFDETQRLLKETEQRAAELATINSVQVSLASKLDIDAIYELIGDKVREVFNVKVVDIVDYDPAVNLISMPYSYENGDRSVISPREPYGFREQVIRTGASLLINRNFVELAAKYNNPLITGEWPRSALFVPLLVNGEVKSIISIQDLDHENAYSDSDVQLLQTLSTAMSVALENARLWEQEKMYRKALERELEIGREIQAGFLPDDLPLVKGWEIAATLMSAREVAGDFYDAFELPDGNIGLVIADICDKGVGAALFMTLFRSLIRATSNQEYFEHAGTLDSLENSIDERLRHAITLTNNYIAETHEKSGMFATLFFGILDPRTGKLTYINGGHEPPLIIQAGSVREILQKTGPAVGAITNCNFQIRETQLQEGDLFFAFTDGVPDSENPHGEFFGRQRLFNIFQHFGGSARVLVDTIKSELHQYINGAARFDDITLMAVRRV